MLSLLGVEVPDKPRLRELKQNTMLPLLALPTGVGKRQRSLRLGLQDGDRTLNANGEPDTTLPNRAALLRQFRPEEFLALCTFGVADALQEALVEGRDVAFALDGDELVGAAEIALPGQGLWLSSLRDEWQTPLTGSTREKLDARKTVKIEYACSAGGLSDDNPRRRKGVGRMLLEVAKGHVERTLVGPAVDDMSRAGWGPDTEKREWVRARTFFVLSSLDEAVDAWQHLGFQRIAAWYDILVTMYRPVFPQGKY